jgi:(p)ppGpp synthase/HD superfamily hydrolase
VNGNLAHGLKPESRLYSPLVERALRVAARAHRDQTRKGTDIPYLTHPAAVAWILLRAGFDEDATLAAALLHDVIEDTDYSAARLEAEFPPEVAEAVAALTERKLADDGSKRPWIERKREHLARVAAAPVAVRGIALADKLHNLTTIVHDLEAGEPVWERFNADRARSLDHARAVVDALGRGDPRLERLAAECRTLIERLER